MQLQKSLDNINAKLFENCKPARKNELFNYLNQWNTSSCSLSLMMDFANFLYVNFCKVQWEPRYASGQNITASLNETVDSVRRAVNDSGDSQDGSSISSSSNFASPDTTINLYTTVTPTPLNNTVVNKNSKLCKNFVEEMLVGLIFLSSEQSTISDATGFSKQQMTNLTNTATATITNLARDSEGIHMRCLLHKFYSKQCSRVADHNFVQPQRVFRSL